MRAKFSLKSVSIVGLLASLSLALSGCGNPQNDDYDAKLAQATQAADRALAAQVAAEKAAQRAEAVAASRPNLPDGPGELTPDNDPTPPDSAPDIPNEQH
jgi:hypothetical protein